MIRGLVVALCCALPVLAQAKDWLFMGMEGSSPGRKAYYVDFLDVQERTPIADTMDAAAKAAAAKSDAEAIRLLTAARIRQVRVVQVMEPKDAPYAVSYTLHFKCTSRQVMFPEVVAWGRDASKKTMARPDWAPMPSGNWIEKAHMIACDEEKWRPIVIAASKARQPERLMNELGMAYVGNHALYTELSDLTWKFFWTDGEQPEFTSTKTAEELEKQRKDTLALLEKTGKNLAQQSEALRQEMANSEKELAFMEQVSKTFKTKPAQQQRIFFGMEGWTEKDIVDFWGVPASARELAGTRQLDYGSVDDTRQSYTVVNGLGAVVGTGQTGELRECELSLLLREGGGKPGFRLVDYRIKGENCHRSTLRKIVK